MAWVTVQGSAQSHRGTPWLRPLSPRREAELVTWVNTFKGLIQTNYASYGLTAGDASSYGTLATNFINAYKRRQGGRDSLAVEYHREGPGQDFSAAQRPAARGDHSKISRNHRPDAVGPGFDRARCSPRRSRRPSAAPELVVLKREGVSVLVRLVDANSTAAASRRAFRARTLFVRRGQPAGGRGRVEVRGADHPARGRTSPSPPTRPRAEGLADRLLVEPPTARSARPATPSAPTSPAAASRCSRRREGEGKG